MRARIILIAIAVRALFPLPAAAQDGPQLYNMSFDEWSRKGGVWYPYAQDASGAQRIWDSGNAGLSKLKMTSVTPEYKHVAVEGEGKAAARIESKKIAWAFVAGNLFNGRFIRLVDMKGVETELGAPFKGRPRSVSGYYHYVPKKINSAKEPYEDMEGKMDQALIEILLMDWSAPRRQQSHIDGFLDPFKDPAIVGRARLEVKRATSGYVEFEIPFTYLKSKAPGYVVFTLCSSALGQWDTGAAGSVLYVDELRFNY